MTTEPPKRRRWLQFRLRTLLIAILVLSVPLSWFAVRLERARRQREAVKAIERLGGYVEFDLDLDTPYWLLRLLGQESVSKPVVVSFKGTLVGDPELAHLEALTDVDLLFLDGTHITDEDLERLPQLPELYGLHLADTRVTDAGLRHLQRFAKSLVQLSLGGCRVSDAGLEHLGGLANLEWLILTETNVTPEGVKKLQAALPNCKIDYRTHHKFHDP